MKQFSDEDLFYKGFMYGMRLSNEGLSPTLDESIPVKELMHNLQRLDRAKEGIGELISELSFKLKQALEGGNYETLR